MKKGFGKAPYLKVPANKKYVPRPHAPPPVAVAQDETILSLEEESDEEQSPVHFTSLRVMVWVNFGLIFMLSTFFLIYVLTRPSLPPPVVSPTVEAHETPEKYEISFTLVPHSESNGKWMLLVTNIQNVERIKALYVCCIKEGVFRCLAQSDVIARSKEVKVTIRNTDVVGATCKLVWLI